MPPRNRDELPGPEQRQIVVRRARTHNLCEIDLDIPHNSLTVVTGVSGSGKSSLVFNTIFAEGQRQYINSLSVQASRLPEMLPRPPVDSITGLRPTLCIEQTDSGGNSRSTVATLSEIYDYLRLLMARVGIPRCHVCGTSIRSQSIAEIVSDIFTNPMGSKLTITAPMIRGRKGSHADAFAAIAKAGLVKARVDGELIDLDDPPKLSATRKHDIEAVCDRIVLREDSTERIEAAVQLAVKLAEGLVGTWTIRPNEESPEQSKSLLYSTKYACPACGINYPEIEPRIFSFNSPYGACKACGGDGSIEGKTCSSCNGARLNIESRSVFIDGLSIDRIVAMTVEEAEVWFANLSFTGLNAEIAEPILRELQPRLSFLHQIGIGYLQLDRKIETLSGGELQRVRLATSLGSGLIGVCYILDEPSIGLHPRDNAKLIEIMCRLRDQGNTLLVVEHDPAIMRAADHLIDIGPGAGRLGGQLLAQGTPSFVANNPTSVTGPFIKSDSDGIRIPSRRRTSQRTLRIQGACLRNLQSIDVDFPLGSLIGVTGVSGSGKSTLVLETLVPAVETNLRKPSKDLLPSSETARMNRPNDTSLGYQQITGLEHIDKIIVVDQQPIGRNARSTPATFVGLWNLIREVFAQTRDAKQRGFKENRFGFNSGPGRCEECLGLGQKPIEVNYLGDLFIPCHRCRGERFNRPTLAVRYRDRSVADILSMTVDEASEFFANFAKITAMLDAMRKVGLGYLRIGQPSQTLSGGEAQRLKLSSELLRPSTGKTLYVFDEPTTGLHPLDIEKLMLAIQGLVDLGNTAVVIEHHLDVIRQCDWLIDLGPDAGPNGGRLLASGPIEVVAEAKDSPTGRFLRS